MSFGKQKNLILNSINEAYHSLSYLTINLSIQNVLGAPVPINETLRTKYERYNFNIRDEGNGISQCQSNGNVP